MLIVGRNRALKVLLEISFKNNYLLNSGYLYEGHFGSMAKELRESGERNGAYLA